MNYFKSATIFFILALSCGTNFGESLKGEVGGNENQADAFAQFVPSETNSVSGFFGFRGLENYETCRFKGYFENGLSSANLADYDLVVESKEGEAVFDLTAAFQRTANIKNSGTEFFQIEYKKVYMNCAEVIGKTLNLYLKGVVIGTAEIQAVV